MGLVPRGAEHGSPRGQARITSPNIGSDKSFVDDLNQAREMEVAVRMNPELKDARKELKRLTS
jgi:hypothetical protein